MGGSHRGESTGAKLLAKGLGKKSCGTKRQRHGVHGL